MDSRARFSTPGGRDATVGSPASELDAILLECDGVGDARVVSLPATDGSERVVVYVASTPGDTLLAAADVRAWLTERLGAATAPGAIVVVDAPGARLDTADLPSPWQARPESEVSYAPPRNAVERTIANVWADVLALDRVGIFDDFFALGGNSFLSVDVLALLAAHGLAVGARAFFENPTVAALAAAIGDHPAPPPVPS